MDMFARIDRDTGDVHLFCDGAQFARLANCEVAHVFVSDDDELADQVELQTEGDMSLRERLAIVRRCYEHLIESRIRENEAERLAECAWLRAAEYDPEAVAEMERENAYC
jgi:hypothetical protein